ncbi:MAG: hypothetical protein LBC18_12480, partial [Opitutaceae bacterium]|nr:hypothetical protein [Opitutaceae bacterium]
PWQLLGELPRDHEWGKITAGDFANIRADKDGRLWTSVFYVIRPDLQPDKVYMTGDPKTMPKAFWNYYRRADEGSWEPEGTREKLLAFDSVGAGRIVGVTVPKGEHPLNKKDTIEHIAPDGTRTELTPKRTFGYTPDSTFVLATPRGDIYAAPAGGNEITLFRKNEPAREITVRRLVERGTRHILALTGDGNWLAAFEGGTTRGQSFRVETDGTLAFGQSFYVLHKPDDADGAGALDAAAEASDMGYLHVATTLGVQILDANGRTAAILPLPGGAAAISLCFGGPDFKTLYALGADGKIHSRPMKNPGALPWLPPAPIKMRAG